MVTNIDEFDKNSQKILIRWFTMRSLSESTQKTYLSYMSQFIQHSEKTLYEIYELAQKQTLDNLSPRERELTQLILEYKYYLDMSDYAQTTKSIKLNIIYSFCKAFEFYVPQIRIKKGICEDKNYERPISKEEIKLMLNNNALREGAFLILQATSGMSSKEARNLSINDLLRCINNELNTHYDKVQDIFNNKEKILSHDAYEIKLIRSKVNYRYITFLSKECMKHIIEYLEFRNSQSSNKKLRYNADEHVFVTNTGKNMSSRTVTAMYREMGKNVGFRNEKNTYRFWRSHNIRKYFYNIVEEIVGIEFADEWLGHVPSHVTRAYARREYRMKQAYLKCLPYLTIEDDVSIIEEKLQKLEEELRQLKGIV